MYLPGAIGPAHPPCLLPALIAVDELHRRATPQHTSLEAWVALPAGSISKVLSQ